MIESNHNFFTFPHLKINNNIFSFLHLRNNSSKNVLHFQTFFILHVNYNLNNINYIYIYTHAVYNTRH